MSLSLSSLSSLSPSPEPQRIRPTAQVVEEEKWMTEKHAAYSAYAEKVPMFFPSDLAKVLPESGPLRAVHVPRHKWPGGGTQLGFRTVE